MQSACDRHHPQGSHRTAVHMSTALQPSTQCRPSFCDGLRLRFGNWPSRLSVAPAFLIIASLWASMARADMPDANQMEKAASWQWPQVALLEQHLVSYLDQVQAGKELREKVLQQWKLTADSLRGPALLDRLLNVSGLIEPRLNELVKQLQNPNAQPIALKQVSWLSSDVPGWLQDAVRLACGRSLAQRRLYDEALETLSGLDHAQVCDPATLIFYRAVCQHHLLQKKECIANAELLLERKTELPLRYAQLSELLAADIKPMKTDSLDEVARLMNDVQRRLDLGRAGKRVRDEEDEIIKKLDKMISDMEEQQQQQQQQQQQSGDQQSQQQNQGKPMDDSRIAGGSGPGNVDQKDIGKRSGWGNLPPAERRESLQRMTLELPSHYREVIESYFRELSKEKK